MPRQLTEKMFPFLAAFFVDQRQKAPSVNARWNLPTCKFQESRHQIDVAQKLVLPDFFSAHAFGELHDQRCFRTGPSASAGCPFAIKNSPPWTKIIFSLKRISLLICSDYPFGVRLYFLVPAAVCLQNNKVLPLCPGVLPPFYSVAGEVGLHDDLLRINCQLQTNLLNRFKLQMLRSRFFSTI